ncbi:MAG TPA: heme-binding domain-containing protein [Bryobacteraceae bacterium]|nr:heme-binding domain-containing protein [Bryobacteraceae bacterium]
MSARIELICGVFALAICGGAVHPFGPVKRDSSAPFFRGAALDTATLERFRRACSNCHSEHVQWPWYSYVAPTSWLVERDVQQAREHLNFSRWSYYPPQERITLLSAIGAALNTHEMPPRRYLTLHPESALSDSERNALYEWTKAERHRLRAPALQQSALTGEKRNAE